MRESVERNSCSIRILLASDVQVSVQSDNRYLRQYRGHERAVHGSRGFARVMITASAKAKDGMDVSDFDSFEAADPKDLPSNDVIRKPQSKRWGARRWKASRRGPRSLSVGPAIFSGRASGVFFHEIFGHRIEGHRQKDEVEGQTRHERA